MFNKLSIDDIMDLRTYERQRVEFRTEIIALKKLRRIAVGPIMTLLLENRSTIRFQIQEMARAEKMATDAQIATELDAYNPLIPGEFEISATLFLELTTKDEMVEWLPKLVGIQEALQLEISGSSGDFVIGATTEEAHKSQLTREDVTASVHYIRFELGAQGAAALSGAVVTLKSIHHHYPYSAVLSRETLDSIRDDWTPVRD